MKADEAICVLSQQCPFDSSMDRNPCVRISPLFALVKNVNMLILKDDCLGKRIRPSVRVQSSEQVVLFRFLVR